MKQVYIEVPLFIVIIFIAMVFMGESFNKPKMTFNHTKLNEVSLCTETKTCLVEARVLEISKAKRNPVTKIKSYLRQKLY
ncbi:hypothetical protein NVI2019_PEGOAJLN_02192 [Providencia alcalifaciens]|uniref:Uncharacterized protein n=1 Tax=Providencia alcalifaciens DSM 30120 TaxID=520999 RepID=B6XJC3_9GAMM|nr:MULTISPECIES: hypothetical protein [Providencia]ATG17038.1 hypothetical protein CO695_12315 [Providencia alcalifaciens]EEB44660.1 hypothetical protein PROVALCAL_03474 [Providencia alcalifaciens DSM 30120]EUD02116.1 hypothetical protein HMPREF1565_1429 [Providencia alcalifaciens RIMD 1656011]MBF0690723.1 hypothetical protein [Providencia alcalifaciens]MTC26925.1 hypothetical protein [Providencia alcalifaciens]